MHFGFYMNHSSFPWYHFRFVMQTIETMSNSLYFSVSFGSFKEARVVKIDKDVEQTLEPRIMELLPAGYELESRTVTVSREPLAMQTTRFDIDTPLSVICSLCQNSPHIHVAIREIPKEQPSTKNETISAFDVLMTIKRDFLPSYR